MGKARCVVDGGRVSHMKTATIRELKHATSAVLEWVEKGESVEIRRRGKPVAVLSRPRARRRAKPDFAARLKGIYGNKVLKVTTTELLAAERGER